MISGEEARERLEEGNRRFFSGRPLRIVMDDQSHRLELARGQQPFAIVLGCSDSRVPPEIIFDQGPGDVFVVRVAGNVVGRTQLGSIEFAAKILGVRLVVVLGHSLCGAVGAALDEMRQPSPDLSPNLSAIVTPIQSSLEALLATGPGDDPDRFLARAVRANVLASVGHLRSGSELLERMIQREGLIVVGAEYCLETGRVDFFHAVPAPG